MKNITSDSPMAARGEPIYKVMSLSALHIPVDTWQMLSIRQDNELLITAIGGCITIDLSPTEIARLREDIPEKENPDLYNCIAYAVKSGCRKLVFGECDNVKYGLRLLNNETQEMVPTYCYTAACRQHTPGRGMAFCRHIWANGMGAYDGTDMLETIDQHPQPRNYLTRTYIWNGNCVTEVYDTVRKTWSLQKIENGGSSK